MKGVVNTDNFDFTPKSLDDLDKEFYENVRALESGLDEAVGKNISSPDNLGIKISKQTETETAEQPAPEPEVQPVGQEKQPEQPTQPQIQVKPPVRKERPKEQPAQPAFKPPVAGNQAVRDSLLPKQMLYKAAPMQTPLNQNEQSPYVMPKDYALYGRDAMRINTPVEEPEQAKEEPVKNKKSKKHPAAVAVSAILLALVVFVSAFTGIMKYYSDNTMRLLGGKSVCVVEKNTKSPYLSRGDIAFVKPVKPEKLEEGNVVAVLQKEKGFFTYGIITDIKESETGKRNVTVKGVNSNSEITESKVRAELILGTVDDYLPKAGYLVNLLNNYTLVCACVAGFIILLLIIILIAAVKSGKKAVADDKSSSI